jgi:hypothetical protein
VARISVLISVIPKPFVARWQKSFNGHFVCSLSGAGGDWHGMKEEQTRFLSLLGQLPARLTAEQAGWVLNCQRACN